MRKSFFLLLCIIALTLLIAQPASATSCGSLPSNGFNLPGIVARLQDNSSSECFVVWFDNPAEYGSFLERNARFDPKLVMSTKAGYYNNHNAGYAWSADVAYIAEGANGPNIKPSNLGLGDVTVLSVTMIDYVDNRLRDWDFGVVNEKIDVAEIITIANRLGAQVGDANFKWMYDLHRDGIIDTYDLTNIADVWNQSFDQFADISSYAPPSCGAWNAYDTTVSFNNMSGQDRTFWLEAQIDGQWYRSESYISVPHNSGGLIGYTSYEQPTSVRLRIADPLIVVVTNISWNRTCHYAPPVVTQVTGYPQLHSPSAVSEAQSAGTYFTAATVEALPWVMTNADLTEIGLTEAQIESSTGRSVEIVPTWSLNQSSWLLADYDWWVTRGWFDTQEFFGSSTWSSYAFAFQWSFAENQPLDPLHLQGYVYWKDTSVNELFEVWQEQDSGWLFIDIGSDDDALSGEVYCFEWAAQLAGQYIGVPEDGPPNIKCQVAP